MNKVKYHKATLDKFSLKELQKICKYYGLEYFPSWSKARLVKEILAYSPPTLVEKTYNYKYEPIIVEPIKPETPKSVRISRIESGKEK